ncbi:MAG: hypothetical protein ACQEW5_26615 [Bacillota bacterium]
MEKKPWYLKTSWVYFFCILMPVVGYLIVFLNLDKLEDTNKEGHSEKIYYLTIATISIAFWLLKFTPHNLRVYTLSAILTFWIGGYILKIINK